MEKNSEQTHESVAAPTSPQGSTRRHFLKGTTLALPAVVTLHSGTALAATSLGCGGMGNLPQTTKVLCDVNDSTGHKNYMREPVTLFRKITIGTTGNNRKVTVKHPGAESYFKGMGVWRHVGTSSGPAAGVPVDVALELEALNKLESNQVTVKNGKPYVTLGTKTYEVIDFDQFKTSTTMLAVVHVSTSPQTGGLPVAVGAPLGSVHNAVVTSLTGACLASLYALK